MESIASSNGVVKEEKGVILILTLFLLPAIIIMLALAIDIGMFLLHRSSMQQAADSTTLAAVQNFDDFTVTAFAPSAPDITRFRDVKPIVLGMLRAQVLDDGGSRGLRPVNSDGVTSLTSGGSYGVGDGIHFDHIPSGNADTPIESRCFDLTNINEQDYPLHRSTCANFGNITVRLTRGARCYGPLTGSSRLRYFCSLEDLPEAPDLNNGVMGESLAWQWSNAVELEMRAAEIGTFFARAFLGDTVFSGVSSTSLSIQSISYLPMNPPQCSHPRCLTEVTSSGNVVPGVFQAQSMGDIPAGPGGSVRCVPIAGFR